MFTVRKRRLSKFYLKKAWKFVLAETKCFKVVCTELKEIWFELNFYYSLLYFNSKSNTVEGCIRLQNVPVDVRESFNETGSFRIFLGQMRIMLKNDWDGSFLKLQLKYTIDFYFFDFSKCIIFTNHILIQFIVTLSY